MVATPETARGEEKRPEAPKRPWVGGVAKRCQRRGGRGEGAAEGAVALGISVAAASGAVARVLARATRPCCFGEPCKAQVAVTPPFRR